MTMRHSAQRMLIYRCEIVAARLGQSMIRTRRAAPAQSVQRFSLATNAERVCAEIMLKPLEWRTNGPRERRAR
jgi:hypothetical protein